MTSVPQKHFLLFFCARRRPELEQLLVTKQSTNSQRCALMIAWVSCLKTIATVEINVWSLLLFRPFPAIPATPPIAVTDNVSGWFIYIVNLTTLGSGTTCSAYAVPLPRPRPRPRETSILCSAKATHGHTTFRGYMLRYNLLLAQTHHLR